LKRIVLKLKLLGGSRNRDYCWKQKRGNAKDAGESEVEYAKKKTEDKGKVESGKWKVER
jgi:hypothetical protein